jgi:glucose/arabinose dehydrogenase
MEQWRVVASALALAGAAGGLFLANGGPLHAQPAAGPPRGPGSPPLTPLGAGPWTFESKSGPIHAEVVASGLDHPWSIAFLGNGAMLVSERPGRLRLIRDGKLDPQPIAGLPANGSLYDVALDPKFASNRLLYLAYMKRNPAKDGDRTLAVARARWAGGHALTEVSDILVTQPWLGARPWPQRCCGQGPAGASLSGRLAFDATRRLLVASGDRDYGEQVQDIGNDFGKILRIETDGSAPADNPFKASPNVWSTGHRNVGGLFYDSRTGRLWETEFGPNGGDELNLIVRGRNYGWMLVTQGEHYDKTPPAKGRKGVPGYTDPMLSFGPPSLNPADVTVYRGKRFARWNGDLFLATFTQGLLHYRLDKSGPVLEDRLLVPLNQRLRSVRTGPDGALYVLTDETAGAVLRLTPGKSIATAQAAP